MTFDITNLTPDELRNLAIDFERNWTERVRAICELRDRANGLAELRRENARLRYAIHMDVGDDSYTHDNALADAIRERDEAVKRRANEEIDHGATAEILIRDQKELAELRAYKERTEAGLVALCRDYMGDLYRLHSAEALRVIRADIETLKLHGLWRDPPQEVKP